jgi:non-ribosomal peptide synthetase component E (peptide arylation enzyme)
MGERICAVIVPRTPGGTVSIDSLQALFRAAGVALFKCPERIRYVESLPRNAVGKVIRSALLPLAEKPD